MFRSITIFIVGSIGVITTSLTNVDTTTTTSNLPIKLIRQFSIAKFKSQLKFS